MTQTITIKNFEETIEKQGVVVLDFWAEWCGPCKAFAPVFEAASTRHADVTWGKIDTEAEQELAGAVGIRSIPTLMVFRDGILVFRESGALPGSALDEIVGKVKELDMDDVRKQIAAHEAEHAAAHARGECNHG